MTEDLSTWTKEELYERAQQLDIEGRSQMNKEELLEAVSEAEGASEAPQEATSNEQAVAATGSAAQGRADDGGHPGPTAATGVGGQQAGPGQPQPAQAPPPDPNLVVGYSAEGQPLNAQGQVVATPSGYARPELDPNTGSPNDASVQQAQQQATGQAPAITQTDPQGNPIDQHR